MRTFTVQLTKTNPNGQIITIDPNLLTGQDRIKFEMTAITLFDQIVENDDCREAREYIKHLQEL